MDDTPLSVALDQHTALIVRAMLHAAFGGGAAEHEGIADDGRIAIELQPGLQQIEASVAGACPAVLDHEAVKVEAVLAMRRDPPLE